MSLRIFHVIFIVSSIALCGLAGGWSIRRYLETGAGSHLGMAVLFLAAALGLIAYAFRAFRKLRELR
ncbi:MAG TPA: hypothetical protein VMT00_03895 [Thermoanaerobaculia bacterium]|nr:hypothetical protein [Thermoanaerobaculia bacterium]